MTPVNPIDYFEELLSALAIEGTCSLGVYRYHPQSVSEERTDHEASTVALRDQFTGLLAATDGRTEIAINSRILVAPDNREVHVPLVDFTEPERVPVQVAAEALVTEYRTQSAALFSSGRSFHLYLGAPLSKAEWVRFMGRILLLNLPGRPQLVDARWVGHRLLAGYSSLRWSARTPPYIDIGPPKMVHRWDGEQPAAR